MSNNFQRIAPQATITDISFCYSHSVRTSGEIFRGTTTLQIKNAAPKETDYTLTDTSGLFMIVKPNGSKLWRFRYRREGKLRRLSLGTYPETSLAQARVQRIKMNYFPIE
ncbi:Arm DNA-binding domain-containing protein [Klebsiella sp. 141240]|uniref:Arm DNA-binding domain-containing protein n=1 Tax=Klebsiella sp. 141240 TaxID=3020034 RepID=UPI003D334759